MSDLNLMDLKGKKRELTEFNDWGGYMEAKIRKLDEQFDDMENDTKQSNVLRNLFKNIVIFVNGYTVPSSDELKRLMKKHGGGFQHYYSKSRCTHIVATNLPDSKIKELKGDKVVHPDWVLDSIKAGKVLSYRNYLLYGPGGKYGDNKAGGILKNVVKLPNDTNCSETTCNNEEDGDKNGISNPDFEVDAIEEDPASRLEELRKNIEVKDQTKAIGNEGEFAEAELLRTETSPTTSSESCINPMLESKENSFDKSRKEYANELNATFANSESLGGSGNNRASKSTLQSRPQHSLTKKSKSVPKAGDPNFVSEFYSHSRLHYLSTWGAEFRDFINNLIQTTELKTAGRSPKKRNVGRRVIMHIDMDSFFVSVALRTRPELIGKPVAVCHAGRGSDTLAAKDSANSSSTFGSTSEIASCSYEARSFGIKNGMWLGQARQLCPDLVCVPYEFNEYRQVSQQLYETLASYTHDIQAVSCDEAFVDLANYMETEALTSLEVAQSIREEIKKKTNCSASAGIASNILLARMCTKVAKPNGQFHLKDDDTAEFIGKQNVSDLPGVGYALNQKLKSLNVVTCMDLQRISMSVLRREFGQKTGEMLYKFCRGQDKRELKIERERKSVSAEINYAIRFVQDSEPEKFIYDLSTEVHKRLKTIGVKGKLVTFKLRVRQKDAPINPTKFMGCGRCDNISRSTNLSSFTDDSSVIAKECILMLKQLTVPVSDIRGMGIQISKLSNENRKASSASHTLHNFMRPLKTTNATCIGTTKMSGAIVRSELSEVERNIDVGGDSHKVTPPGTSCHEMENDDEFKLLLSDEEEEGSFDPQEPCKANSLSTSLDDQGKREQDLICNGSNSLGTRHNFPPLPVFPIFSPKRSESPNKKSSPLNIGKTKTSSRSKSFTRSNKTTPKKSPRKSPNKTSKSPGKVSSPQRSLLSSFQSFKRNDTINALALPSPSQIDPTVFAALPEEIKKDIEISYQQRNQRFANRAAERLFGVTEDHMTKLCLPSQFDLEEDAFLPVGLNKNLKHEHERSEKIVKKSKVKHKSIKRFASTKMHPSKDDEMPKLDDSVLDALPESIRHEVQLAYEQQKRHDEKGKKKQDMVNQKKKAFISEQTVPRKRYETDVTCLPSSKVYLAGSESLTEIKEMLTLWTNEAEVPSDEDVGVFLEYLSNLIFVKDLEKMWLVLKFYRRLLINKETWKPLFNTVLDRIQGILKQSYGGQLPMKYFIVSNE